MTLWVAILLGIIQGLSEFLPISSSGHLVLFQQILGINTNCLFFDIVVHLGTLLAVFIVFHKKIFYIIKHPFCELSQKIVFATIPTIIIALLFKDFFTTSFNGEYLFIGFFVTAIFMFIADYVCKHNYQYKNLGVGNSIIIGIFQGIAIIPGISRSGTTITCALAQGIRRNESSEFSFLLNIPTIIGSLIFELINMKSAAINISFTPLLVGFIFSALFGCFAIKLMLKIIKKARFKYFGFYLLALSLFLLINKYLLFWF